jgi:NADPH:quinone reductase-like Zn-dependent oxidoreductase
VKAIRIHKYGGPEVLQYEDAPRPKAQAGEVLIRVHAAGVNPIDWKIRAGYLKDLFPVKFPLILGWEVSGTVEEVGPGAPTFKKTDEVFAMADPTGEGGYAEYIVINQAFAAFKPKSVHHVHAAALPLAALTAWKSLFEAGQLKLGQRVLVHAGSGGVGHLAVQLAKWRGAHVFATASTKNQQFLGELGVDEPIDYTKQKFEDVARDVDVVLDTIGGETQERSWGVLNKGGVLVSLLQLPSEEKARSHGVRGAMVNNRPDGVALAEIGKLIDSGKIKVILDRILSLSEAHRAHELSESGHVRGKIVLRVMEE